MQSKQSILFIGNSFSYFNDLNKPDGLFYNVAVNAGHNVKVDCVYKGGYTLQKFLDPNDQYGAKVSAKLSHEHYGIIIIQEQSHTPISNTAQFFDSCRRFKELADRNGAELLLYATWGYKAGQCELTRYGTDTADMEMKLRASYTAIASELGINVANVGAAFTKMLASFPNTEIYDPDLKHPGINGSYLAAWVLFGTVFGVDPSTLSYNGILDPVTAEALRTVASDIVCNGAPIAEGYGIS